MNVNQHGGMFEVPGDRLREMSATIAQHRATIRTLRAALDAVQWVLSEDEFYFCPSCGGRDGDHAELCKLKLALAATEGQA